MGISETGGNMLKTLKKMILHTKKDSDLDKPNFERDSERDENHFNENRFGPREDYHIPEPEDIRRMPTPGFQNPRPDPEPRGVDYDRDLQPIPMPERREPMPVPRQRPPEPAPQPRYPGRDIEDALNQILYRLDDIERRLARLEGYPPPRPQPQPRRY
ncbi:MAG: hypothetical protein JSV92_00495 [archaeon]|nr:MAG: hypothetical protein JSV92_00495 [archaeon]